MADRNFYCPGCGATAECRGAYQQYTEGRDVPLCPGCQAPMADAADEATAPPTAWHRQLGRQLRGVITTFLPPEERN